METYCFIGAPHYVKDWYRPEGERKDVIKAEHELDPHDTYPFDGYVGLSDLGSFIASVLNQRLGKPAPDPLSLLRAQDKYFVRSTEKGLGLYGGLIERAAPNLELTYPLFAKPAFGTISLGAQKLTMPEDLAKLFTVENQSLLSKEQDLWGVWAAQAGVSDLIANDPMNYYLVEDLACEGKQVTLDCWVQDGQVEFIGFTLSHFFSFAPSFSRFESLVRFSEKLETKMRDHAVALITALGLDHTFLNFEYVVDEENERFSLIEINTRMATQFAEAIQQLTSLCMLNASVKILKSEKAESKVATPLNRTSILILRRTEDGTVVKSPSEKEIEIFCNSNPAVISAMALVEPGRLLSSYYQDNYTYRYGQITVKHDVDLSKAEEQSLRHSFELMFTFSAI